MQAASMAANRLVNTPLFKKSRHVACYFAQENEFDCAPIIQEVWRTKKKCYLPILSKRKHGSLEFCLYQKDTPLILNRYHIAEPDAVSLFPPDQLDLVIMPLVGFDLEGHRLGMGGGYYDRTFYFLRKNDSPRPFMLGLAYEVQYYSTILTEEWDVAMDGMLTEKKLYLF